MGLWLIHTPVCLPVCLSVCQPVCLPACLSVCLCVCLSVCLPGCHPVSTRLSDDLSICLSDCLFVCLSVCLSVRLSVCRSSVSHWGHTLSQSLVSRSSLTNFHASCFFVLPRYSVCLILSQILTLHKHHDALAFLVEFSHATLLA